MALATGNRAVSAEQWELGFGMIETINVRPGLYRVASFATEGRAVSTPASHAIVKLALMRIGVARGAAVILEVERHDLVGSAGSADLVAIATGHGDMCSRESKVCVSMFCDCEC